MTKGGRQNLLSKRHIVCFIASNDFIEVVLCVEAPPNAKALPWFVAGDLLTRSLLVASRLSSFEQERPFSALTDTAGDRVLFRLLATSAYNAMQQGFATLSQRLAVGAAAWTSWLSASLVHAGWLGWLGWLCKLAGLCRLAVSHLRAL